MPNADLCIDEQLVPFKGNCPFRLYMKSKPDKYGIKVWTLCDARSNYAWNMQVYTGKTGAAPEKEQGKRVVLDLVSELQSGYGVTTDNFFTSLSLADALGKQHKTLTGTMRNRRRGVPVALRPDKFRSEHSSQFVYTKDTMMVSYVPIKDVLL